MPAPVPELPLSREGSSAGQCEPALRYRFFHPPFTALIVGSVLRRVTARRANRRITRTNVAMREETREPPGGFGVNARSGKESDSRRAPA